jgi:uncharacterized integral membrane protein (TIGR00698 family)
MERFRELLPGVGITLSIVFISFLAYSLHAGFDPLVVSLIFGILAVNILGDRGPLAAGVDVCLKYLLPVGILLYGTQVQFKAADSSLLMKTIGLTVVSFVVAFFVSRGFGLGRVNSVLIGTGLSVCGVAGVALIAPLLKARRDETAVSVISVMTVGLTGMLLYKFAPGLFGLKQANYAFLTGTTLPMLGQVHVIAMTGTAGAAALKFMYFRMGLLAVVAGAAVVHARMSGRMAGVPWFMVGFLALAVLVNLVHWGGWETTLRGWTGIVAQGILAGGLAAVGLSLEFDAITSRGSLPLFAAYLSWGIMVLTVYLLMSLAR